MASPVGPLRIVTDGLAIVRLAFDAPDEDPAVRSVTDDTTARLLGEARRQLDEYFAGRREGFNLPLDPGGTAFQRSVWTALREIPFGTTRSYCAIADRIGNPKAVRAVGLANGQNPIPILIPCHRVIGRDGSLTGFGGGLERKLWLLTHEGALLGARSVTAARPESAAGGGG